MTLGKPSRYQREKARRPTYDTLLARQLGLDARDIAALSVTEFAGFELNHTLVLYRCPYLECAPGSPVLCQRCTKKKFAEKTT